MRTMAVLPRVGLHENEAGLAADGTVRDTDPNGSGTAATCLGTAKSKTSARKMEARGGLRPITKMARH